MCALHALVHSGRSQSRPAGDKMQLFVGHKCDVHALSRSCNQHSAVLMRSKSFEARQKDRLEVEAVVSGSTDPHHRLQGMQSIQHT